jgi:hypothetical protein
VRPPSANKVQESGEGGATDDSRKLTTDLREHHATNVEVSVPTIWHLDGVRLFYSNSDESNFDHLTSLSFGREGGSGLGTAPSA